MFIDTQSRPAGEVQQKVGRIKLSEAIKAGALYVPETRAYWGCAIGAACFATGLKVTILNYPEIGTYAMYRHLVNKTSASWDTICTVSEKHYAGQSRESLVAWLEAQGL